MPFQSEKQRRYLWANEPEIAREWTDRYGARGGGIMHQFENYAHDDGNNVSVPRSFQARPNTEQVNLAYITPEEEGILQMLKPDTPHIGPMNVPNYDARDARGNFGTSGQHDAPTAGDVAAGVGSTTGGGAGDTRIGTIKQDIQKVNRGIRPAGYNVNQFQNNNAVNRNRNRFSNIVGRLRGWNPITNDWNTQDEYNKARTKRQNRSRIDRLRKTRDYGKYANNPQGWANSTLSGRLTGLEKNVFGKDYVDYGRTALKARDLKALRDQQALTNKLSAKDFINLDQSISASGYKPRSFMENLQSKYPGAKPAGLNKEQIDFLNAINTQNKAVGYSGLSTTHKSERNPDWMAGAFFENTSPTDVWGSIQSLNPKSRSLGFTGLNFDPDKIVSGDTSTYAQPSEVTGYIQSLSPEDQTYSWGLRKNEEGVDYTDLAKGGLASLWPR